MAELLYQIAICCTGVPDKVDTERTFDIYLDHLQKCRPSFTRRL